MGGALVAPRARMGAQGAVNIIARRIGLVYLLIGGIAAFGLSIACGDDSGGSRVPSGEAETQEPGPEQPRPSQPAALVQRSRPLMGTVFQVSVAGVEEVP